MADKKTVWTDAQKSAINHRGGAAVVSAAAGSGKTAVLTERVISLITDKNENIDPSKAAIVTFTEKAAGELKTRLDRLMKQKIAENPADSVFLRSQSAKLHSARISTISSFCFNLLRENSELADLPLGFSVIDEMRAELLRRTIADYVAEEFFRTAAEDERALISDYFIGRDDSALIGLILEIYSTAMNIPDFEDWLDMCADKRIFNAVKNSLISSLKHYTASATEYYHEFCENVDCTSDEKTAKTAPKYVENITGSLYAALERLKENGYRYDDEIKALMDNMPARATPTKDPSVAQSRSDMLKYGKKAIEYAERAHNFDKEAYEYLPVLKILVGIAKRFCTLYTEEKHSQCVADFADAEQGLYKMLKNHPEVKERTGLQLIIVDEFQDSNELQYEIFRMLSDNEKNLYFVGDIKQSIYSFRGAQPDVFSRVSEAENYTLLPLNKNFRSKRCVTDGVNAVFDEIMTKSLGGADYKKDSRLECGRGDECLPCDVTEIVAVKPRNDDMSKTEAEADYVAYRIRSMINSGYKVFGRPCTEDDFAILLRSPKSKLAAFTAALEKYGLDACAEQSEEYLKTREISIMTDYLTALDNPYNDEALARLLMSVVFGFDADRMSRIRTGTCGFDIPKLRESCPDELMRYSREWSKKPLYTCVLYAAAERTIDSEKYPALSKSEYISTAADPACLDFINELNRLRSVLAASSPADTIQKIYDTTNTVNLLTLCDNPAQCLANLEMLTEYAKYYSGTGGGIMSDFLHNFKNTENQNSPIMSVQKSAGRGVKIMSIHGSKGLQFPVCFVSDCSKVFNSEDIRKNVIVSKTYGICGKIIDKKQMSRIPSPTYAFAAEELRRKMRSEEMRLLYVAATRAEEKLIFTGSTAKEPDKLFEKAFTSYSADTGGSSYMAWLLSVMDLWDEGGVLDMDRREVYCRGGALKFSHVYAPADEYEVIKAGTADKPAEDKTDNDLIRKAEEIEDNIKYRYKYEALTRTAAKYTATELVRNRKINHGSSKNCELYISMPAFMNDGDKKLSGKRRGDAYHKVMEHIPFEKALSAGEIADFIRNDTTDYMTDKERECVDPEDIAAFFNTDVAQRMLKSDRVYREYPIFHKLDVSCLTAAELGLPEGTDFSDAEPYMQGIADMLFIENGRIILVDYKSDSFSDEDHLISDYAFQLDLYTRALEQAFSLPVSERYIYSFKLGKMIDADKNYRKENEP